MSKNCFGAARLIVVVKLGREIFGAARLIFMVKEGNEFWWISCHEEDVVVKKLYDGEIFGTQSGGTDLE